MMDCYYRLFGVVDNAKHSTETYVSVLIHVLEENRFGQPHNFQYSITTTALLKRGHTPVIVAHC